MRRRFYILFRFIHSVKAYSCFLAYRASTVIVLSFVEFAFPEHFRRFVPFAHFSGIHLTACRSGSVLPVIFDKRAIPPATCKERGILTTLCCLDAFSEAVTEINRTISRTRKALRAPDLTNYRERGIIKPRFFRRGDMEKTRKDPFSASSGAFWSIGCRRRSYGKERPSC